MSKKFNLEDHTGKYVMHCKTEEEAKDFCRVLHEAGRKWDGGGSYLQTTNWHDNKMCYNFNTGLYSDILFYLRHDYKILEWSDFMEKEFTKSDLRNGDVVLRRDGCVRIYIESYDLFIGPCGGDWMRGGSYTKDLKVKSGDERYDIIAISRPNDISDMSFDAFEKKLGRLVYEREETVEMTIEEVCKALGKNVKIVKGDK